MTKYINKKYKYQKEIEKHRLLYENKGLKRVKDKWIFYWKYLAHLIDIGYSQRTVRDYYGVLRMFLMWTKKETVDIINKQDIEGFLLHLKNDRKWQPYSIRYPKEKLGMFFEYIMRYCLKIKKNPTANLDIRIHYKQKEKMDYFTQDEIEMIIKKPLQVLSRIDKRDFKCTYLFEQKHYTIKMEYLILKLMFSTGIRPCEIINIEIDDIMPKELKLRIRSKGNQQYIMKDRHVYISKKTLSEIGDLLEIQKNRRTAQSRQKLFIYDNGGNLGHNYPNIVLKYWANLCGIKRRIYAYMARYTYCTRLVENGADIYSLKTLMGHKQLAVTLKHYLKLTPQEIRKEWKQYNPLNQSNIQVEQGASL